jgi:hypothetical protein
MDDAAKPVTKEPRLGLVSSYGLFWKRDEAEWEAADGFHREPRMLGRKGHGSSRHVANFYQLPGIYVLYGNHGAVYVGITGATQGLGKRVRAHVTDRLADKWDKFSWFGYGALEMGRHRIEMPSKLPLDPIPHKWAIRDFEASVIRALDVPSNSKNSGFRAGDIIWEQVRRADVEPLLKRHAGL